MANLTKNEKYIVDMYVRYFGRAADAQTIASYAEHKKTSVILKNIIADADAEKDLDTTEFVNNAFQNLFGRKANTKEMNKYSKVIEKGKNLPINSIVKSAAKADKAVYNNKKAVALKYAELGGTKELDLSKISKGNLVDLNKVFTLTDLTNAIENLADNSGIPSAFDGKTFILTTGADPITGTAKNDIFVATEDTLTSNDKLNGGQGQDTLDIVDRGGSAFNGFEANGIETIKVTADSAAAGTSVDLTYATDATKLVNANSSQDLTFDAIDTVPVEGLELTKVTSGDTRLNFEATAVVGTADVLNVKLDNVKSTANTAVSSIVSNGIETVNVTTTGTESKLVDIKAGQTKVVIAGDKNLTIDNGPTTILAATTTIDASAFKGNLTLGTVDSAGIDKDVEVIGGSGNDKVSFNNGFQIGDKFDGGTGTDTIIMTDSAASVAAGGTLANVEELEISDNGKSTIDMDNFASVSKVIYQAGISAASTATVKDAVSGLTVNVDSVGANNGTLNVALKADTSSDVVNVEIDEVTAANTIVALNANEAETLNLTVNDNAAVVGKGALTVNNLSATDATKLNIKSDADLTIANVVDPATAILATIDANTSTGNLTISNVNTVATGATIILGAGNDVYNVATSNGADTITLGAGADKIVYNDVAQSDTDMDTITDFKQGQDTLDLRAVGVTTGTVFVGNKATFAQAQGALKGAGTVSAVFQQDEKILWVDTNIDGTLDNRDFRIKLDGITDLTTIDLGFGAGVSFTAKKAGFDTTKATDSDEGTVTGIKDDTINATIAQLVGSTVDGLGGSDTLTLTTAGAVGTITAQNVENLVLATVGGTANTAVSLALTTDFTSVTGSSNADTLSVTNLVAGGTVNMGAGNDAVNNMTEAIVEGAGSTFVGGDGADTLTFTTGLTTADLDLSRVSGFETIDLGTVAAGAVVTTAGKFASDVTTLKGDTTNGNITVNMTAAQLAALTTITSAVGTNIFTVVANDTGAVTIDLSNNTGFATNVDSVSFAAASSLSVTMDENIAVTGTAGADTVYITADLGALTLATVNIETVEVSTTQTGLTIANTATTVNASAGGTFILGTGGDTFTATGSASNIVTGGINDDTFNYANSTGTTTTTGGAGIDTITLNSTNGVVDTIKFNNGGAGTGITLAADRDVVTGFNVANDIITLDSDQTAVTFVAIQSAISNATVTTGTGFSSVLTLNFDLGGAANVIGASTNGSAIIANMAGAINVTNSDSGYIVAYDAGNAYLYAYTDSVAADTTLDASEITLIGTFNDVAVGALGTANFAELA